MLFRSQRQYRRGFGDRDRSQQGRGGDRTPQRIKDIVNAALKQTRLSECLNEWFGPGTILTNANLPCLDVRQSSGQITDIVGRPAIGTPKQPVPPSGRGTVLVGSDVYMNPLVGNSFIADIYLHETANILAYQRFTNVPYLDRPFRGPLGGPPTAEQNAERRQGGDADIGKQFENCLEGK